ncbi:ABC transporter permease [Shewanella aestuarii]|uniref:FtsX-like permease family protein n=1 Tax=Shewanella aestuarii TaxID=1028752 RepID=A0A6G9QGK6_9GAMM|nr:ABC transporter permease [Shewanella aestuarii]QIR13606.1 FtsX-like permease family protein [Shewanella aestuarii]
MSFALIQRGLKIFWQHYRHAPIQASAILLGIILAVTLLIGVKATNENAKQSYGQTNELLSQRANFFITNKDQSPLNEAVYFALRRSGIKSLAVIEGLANDPQGRSWLVTGSDLVAALTLQTQDNNTHSARHNNQASTSSSSTLSSSTPDDSASNGPSFSLINGQASVMMSANLIDKVNKLTGQQLILNDINIDVIAIDDSFNLGTSLLADISFAQRLLNMPQQLSYIAVFAEDSPDTALTKSQQIDQQRSVIITALAKGGFDTSKLTIDMQDDGESLSALTASFHLNLDAMSMLAFVVGLFIAYNGVRYSLMKRQKLFVQLLQMGLGRQNMLVALIIEITCLVIIGSIAGFILGLQLSQWLQPMVAMTLEQIYGATLLPGIWQWQWFAQGLGLTLFASLAACLPLLIQLTRIPLAQGAQRQAHIAPFESIFKKQAFIACLLLTICGLLFNVTNQYKHSLILLGIVSISIPLLLPQTINLAIKWLQPLMPKGLWQYVVAESKEIIAPLSLAMMAILLALCANISMNTLVDSFEVTLKQWLDGRLHADLYVKPNPNTMPALIKLLNSNKQVDDVFEQWTIDAKLNTPNVPINLVSRDLPSIKETTIMKSTTVETAASTSDDFWQQFKQGHTVLISEPLAIKHQLSIGDSISIDKLPHPNDNPLTISAIYFDYGNPKGEVIISPTLWHQHNLPPNPISLAVRYQGETNELQQLLMSELGVSSAFMYSQQRIKDEAITMFTKTFSITVVLNSLTLLVAAIGLFSACLMLTQARLAPLARLYALGVSRNQLRLMVTSQMMLIVLITCLLALPMGALLGYLLINKVTLQAFGWTIAMLWDWSAYIRVVAIALISCLIAVALPLYWQTRKPLISSLQQEAL